MTQQIQKSRLQKGDFVAFPVTVADVDSQDFTLWLEITDITEIDGETAYTVEFPDGEAKRVPIRESQVREFRRALPPPYCDCGAAVTMTTEFCVCGQRLFPF